MWLIIPNITARVSVVTEIAENIFRFCLYQQVKITFRNVAFIIFDSSVVIIGATRYPTLKTIFRYLNT
jgi:hypothetical protein